ncbi:MAG TPA: tetratricopeptide repeat protein [Bryobacteraceae bacterium]|nr:tetratricopeptide repeat protein [Bryobacteraceae bacterium]
MPIAVCSLALLAGTYLAAQDLQLSEAYDHFYNLEYDDAVADFTADTEQHPDDPGAWNHLAQAILYQAMYRSGALESELVSGSNPFLRRTKVRITAAEHQRFDDAIGAALRLAQAQLQTDPDDPRAIYAQGVAYGLRANYNFLVRKAWLDALHDATDARKAHNRLCELEPDNVDARLIPGVYDYVAGSLPFGYRILGFLAGYHGDRDRGIRTLESVARQGASNRTDAQVLLAAIYRREHRPKDAVPLVADLIAQFPRNHLLRFELVQMYSDLGDEQAARDEIARIWNLHSSGTPGFAGLAPEKIDYLEGNFLFWFNDLDHALEHIKKATAKAAQLDLNTCLLSWMRLGQIYDLKKRRPQALAAYRKAVAVAQQSEIAKESKGYIARPYRRSREPESGGESEESRAQNPESVPAQPTN